MKKLLMMSITLAALISLSSAAFAAGYGGPGSLVAGTSPGAIQLVGVTTNVILQPTQYSAITS